jgi:hypothetical protein
MDLPACLQRFSCCKQAGGWSDVEGSALGTSGECVCAARRAGAARERGTPGCRRRRYPAPCRMRRTLLHPREQCRRHRLAIGRHGEWPGRVDRRPGADNGRLDLLLDAGTYKLRTAGANAMTGVATLTVGAVPGGGGRRTRRAGSTRQRRCAGPATAQLLVHAGYPAQRPPGSRGPRAERPADLERAWRPPRRRRHGAPAGGSSRSPRAQRSADAGAGARQLPGDRLWRPIPAPGPMAMLCRHWCCGWPGRAHWMEGWVAGRIGRFGSEVFEATSQAGLFRLTVRPARRPRFGCEPAKRPSQLLPSSPKAVRPVRCCAPVHNRISHVLPKSTAGKARPFSCAP